jgi:hypothetical protein
MVNYICWEKKKMSIIWNGIKNKFNEIKGTSNGKITSRRSSTNARTTRVTSTYHARGDEFYIAVDGAKATTIYLPTAPSDGKIIIVKSEMRPPMGGRYITIATTDGSLIDGYDDTTITVSHDCKTLIFHNAGWHIIG